MKNKRSLPSLVSPFVRIALSMLVLAGGASIAAATGPRVQRWIEGAPIQGASGIAFDHQDRLYVASALGREIVQMNPRNGKILARIGPPEAVGTPVELTARQDGSLFWTSNFTGEVLRRTPDGTITVIAEPGFGANPITFSDDGRLFVGVTQFGTDAVYEVDPAGVAPPRRVASDLGGINGFDFAPDGLLYSPSRAGGEIIRIDVDSGMVEPVADGFVRPVALQFDAQGELFVADTATGQIVRVDVAGGGKQVVARLESGIDSLSFDSRGRLFVAYINDGSVVQVLRSGRPRVISKGGLISPSGVAVLDRPGRRETVYLADFITLRTLDGRSGRRVDGELFIPGLTDLTSPNTLHADADGTLVISSWLGNTVQVWDPEVGEVLQSFQDFAVPLNAIRFQGDLVVAELGSTRVVRANAGDPSLRETLVTLPVPTGLAAIAGDLYVADWATGRVLQIVAAGQTLAEPVMLAGGLLGPEGLAVAPDGALLAYEAGAGRVTRIDPATGESSLYVDGLGVGAPAPPNAPPVWFFNDLAFGPDGHLFLTSDQANALYRISDKRTLDPEAGKAGRLRSAP